MSNSIERNGTRQIESHTHTLTLKKTKFTTILKILAIVIFLCVKVYERKSYERFRSVKSDRKISLKFACFSIVDYGHRKDAVEIVFISY